MGSEQSSSAASSQRQVQRTPQIRRGYTIATPSRPAEVARSSDPPASGNNSPGASVCSDSELPYISYTVDRPIGDSPKHSKPRPTSVKKPPPRRAPPPRPRRHDIVVVKQPAAHEQADPHVLRLQEIPTFLPIMRGALGLPGARDAEAQAGLDPRPWVRAATRLQAHLAACAHPISKHQAGLLPGINQIDTDISKLHAMFVERQRANARSAERLSRVREVSHQLVRCHSLLNQTLQDIEELNFLLPEDKRLEPFVWNS
ncbi:unnamed protein product [Plutella xylostella]|uniref:BLOC-1-related complex subunit 5 n=1 Tax=Plutella xylostella TaxID=51655 RepID=A0A8S4FVI4_PLUXY|nr:unnamed protein product [Plutella xylostella]